MNENTTDLARFCMRARALITKGQMDDALDLYGDVLHVDPDNALAYADRGTAYAMQKKFDLALNDLQRAFKLGYADAAAYSTVATVCLELKHFQKGLACFSKAIELNPDYPLTYYNRAYVWHELGDDSAAITDLEKCLALAPDEDFKALVVRRLTALRSQFTDVGN